MISALPAAEREQRARSYAAWLDDRNGRIGPDARTLERREAAMTRAEAWSWPASTAVRREAYERGLGQRRPPKTLDRATLWALCLAKASAAESFGAAVGTNFSEASDTHIASILAHIEAEEAYHARTARCLLRALGLETEPPPPDALTRALVRVMAGLPERWGGGVVVYSGEVTAAALFRLLRRSLADVFPRGTTAFEIAGGLIDEVIIDEEAHARFAASRLGQIDVGVTRGIWPLVVRLLALTLPEAVYLFTGELSSEVDRVERELWDA